MNTQQKKTASPKSKRTAKAVKKGSYSIKPGKSSSPVRSSKRTNKAEKKGSRSKFKIAFTTRRRGKTRQTTINQIMVDPVGSTDKLGKKTFSSSEIIELTNTQLFQLAAQGLSTTFAAVLSQPTDKIGFRWITSKDLRLLRSASQGLKSK